ncbi:MAG TPA: quinone oxidoreductase [Pyrinomonadaceae bacterium]|nr:quinone oxidoreductase [Pyrinomonadaceae bacterium]
MKAIRVEEYGGADKLVYRNVDWPEPKAGEALVRLEAIGVNYIDVYHRTGLYPQTLPFTPGSEAAGTVAAIGEGVAEIRVGDRVAYAMALGSYAEYAVVPAAKLVKVPDGVDAETAAAAMLQGMTAHYLMTSTYALKRGDAALVHAAAGGVGLLLIQMAKRVGARVFGTVSTADKAALAREAGADVVINYTEQDFQEEVRRETGGRGVEVVYDSVGRTTFHKSLDCLAPRGMLALFGQSSGTVPPFDAALLAQKGSLFLTRPSLAHYVLTREELLWRAGEVFEWTLAGELKLRIGKTFPLAEAAEAHRQLEGRATTGKVLLIP